MRTFFTGAAAGLRAVRAPSQAVARDRVLSVLPLACGQRVAGGFADPVDTRLLAAVGWRGAPCPKPAGAVS